VAGTDAYGALHTLIGIEIEKRVAGVNGKILGHMIETIKPVFIDTYTAYQFLKAALPALGTEKAVEVMITQNKLKDHLAQSCNFRIVCNTHHCFFSNGPAGRFKSPSILDPDQTQATYAYG
jgi:hypothetical protein